MNWATAYNWTEKYLRGLSSDEWVALEDVKVNDKSVLVECIKQYIDWHKDVEFSNDYASIKRINLPEGIN